jgi:hypothetical protein
MRVVQSKSSGPDCKLAGTPSPPLRHSHRNWADPRPGTGRTSCGSRNGVSHKTKQSTGIQRAPPGPVPNPRQEKRGGPAKPRVQKWDTSPTTDLKRTKNTHRGSQLPSSTASDPPPALFPSSSISFWHTCHLHSSTVLPHAGRYHLASSRGNSLRSLSQRGGLPYRPIAAPSALPP